MLKSTVVSHLTLSLRTRVVLFNVIFAFFGRSVNLISTVILVPILVHALGYSRYGVLAIVISLNNFLAYSDFGLGQTIVNELSSSGLRDKPELARAIISQVWFFLLTIAFVVIITGLICVPLGMPSGLLPTLPMDDATITWEILIIASAFGIPFALAQRVFFSLQLGVHAQVWNTISRVSVVAGSALAAAFAPRITIFVLVVAGIPTIIAGLSCFHVFFSVCPELRPSIRCVSSIGLRKRISIGLQFMILQLSNLAEVGLDPFLIGFFYKTEVVANYDIVTRMFNYVPALISIGIVPLWPALKAADTDGDARWTKQIKSVFTFGVAIVSIITAISIAFNANAIAYLWTRTNIDADSVFLSLLALNTIIFSFYYWQMIQLNASGKIAVQARVGAAYSVVLLIAKLMFLPFGTTNFLIPVVALGAIRLIFLNSIIQR